jgi:hypothetical protein
MPIVLFIIVVLIVMALLLYAVQMIPFPVTPPMPWLKPLLMALIVVFAALAILSRATGYYAW